ncbi:hypothetical protein DMUE_0154 [Dictyocoela muelleri]|nr:hypothetical protein DMUE_0154 [Dictyocoela muelleri]
MNCIITPQKGMFLNKILTSPEIIISISTNIVIQQINPTHTCLSNLILENHFFEDISIHRAICVRLNKPKFYYMHTETISMAIDIGLNILKLIFTLLDGNRLTRVYNTVRDNLYEIEFDAVYYPFPLSFNEILKNINDNDAEIEIGDQLLIKGKYTKIKTCLTANSKIYYDPENNDFKDDYFKDDDFKDDDFKNNDFKDDDFKYDDFKNNDFKDNDFKDDDFKDDDFKGTAVKSFKGIINIKQLKFIFSKADNFYSINYGCDGDNINFNFEGDECVWSVFMTI